MEVYLVEFVFFFYKGEGRVCLYLILERVLDCFLFVFFLVFNCKENLLIKKIYIINFSKKMFFCSYFLRLLGDVFRKEKIIL